MSTILVHLVLKINVGGTNDWCGGYLRLTPSAPLLVLLVPVSTGGGGYQLVQGGGVPVIGFTPSENCCFLKEFTRSAISRALYSSSSTSSHVCFKMARYTMLPLILLAWFRMVSKNMELGSLMILSRCIFERSRVHFWDLWWYGVGWSLMCTLFRIS